MSNLYFDEGEKAKGQKVLIATTVYDSPSPGYVFSIQKSRMALEKACIQTAYLLLAGNCHVDDSRNSVVQSFLLTDCTDLVFIDADVSWDTDSIVTLCKSKADLVGGIYPYRREGQDEKLPVLLIPDVNKPNEDGLLQVAGLPTGFMKIKREVIESLCEDANHFASKTETRSKVPILFERTYEDGARWGGDITFCRKWHKKGGKMYAIPDLRLGHTGIVTLTDSLSGSIRRKAKETIKYMANKIKENDFDPHLFAEVLKAEGNLFSALEDVLMMCALLAKKADRPIIETGSGITSVVLAAASDQQVYSLEHDDYWADRTEQLAEQAGIDNLNVVRCEIKDNWYDLPDNLPKEFYLGVNDGPPRLVGDIGSRMGFFEHFGKTPNIIVDDADDDGYSETLNSWCASNDRKIDYIERSALIR